MQDIIQKYKNKFDFAVPRQSRFAPPRGAYLSRLKRLIHHHPDDDDHRDGRHFVVSAKEHAAFLTAFLAQLHHIAAKIQMKRRKDNDDGELDVHVAAAQKLRHRDDDQNARQKRADQRDPADVVVHLVLLHLDDAYEIRLVHILRVIDVEARLIEQKRHPRDETQVVEVLDEVVILCHFFSF